MYETAEQGVAREVAEETGLQVTETHYLFSLPNLYMYSGFCVHTMDLFFRCTVEDATRYQAMDDAAALSFVPLREVRPELFGLTSIRSGLERFLKEYRY